METALRIYNNIIKGQNILKMLTYINISISLWPQHATIKDGDTFDFIVVGGGTAGCLITSNLVKQKFNVLLIEAGAQPTIETELPGLFPYLKETNYDWNFTSVRNETKLRYHRGEAIKLQQGKVLGGSSQVGYMIHGYGNRKDYDEWATITNDTSWTLKSLCPLLKRTEKVTYKPILNSPDVFFHGTKGKLRIKKYKAKGNEKVFESYKEMGYKVLNDINPKNPIGFTNCFFSIGCGIRQSTASAFLSPVKDSPYLNVLYNSLATKIIFDDKHRAVGVQVLTKDKKLITVKATKEIIVTAGAIKSPHLLMLSGVGPKDHLKSKGIEVISDLPVGQNLQDNPTNIVVHKLGEATPNPPPNYHEFPVEVMEGQVAVNKNQDRADYQVLSGIMTEPKFFLEVCGFVFNFKNTLCDRIFKKMSNSQAHFITHNLLYSESRGEILLKSADPEENPIIDPQYYSNERDLERHAEYLEHYNAIVNTSYYRSLKAELVDPELETCAGIERDTRAYWKCYAQGMATTSNYFVGTCAMGSVVDSELRVKGVKHLRVADSSVMPKIVGSTVQGTVMIIAQKLTDLLRKQYKH